jgi:hypothetical protein
MLARSKLNVFDWIAILPRIASLIGDVVEALRDGKLSPDEVTRIGGELIAIVASVVTK